MIELRQSYVGVVANCLILCLNSTHMPNWHISLQDHFLGEGRPCALEQQHGAGVGETQPSTLSLAASTTWRSPTTHSYPCQVDGYREGFVHTAQTSLLPDGLCTSMLDCIWPTLSLSPIRNLGSPEVQLFLHAWRFWIHTAQNNVRIQHTKAVDRVL